MKERRVEKKERKEKSESADISLVRNNRSEWMKEKEIQRVIITMVSE